MEHKEKHVISHDTQNSEFMTTFYKI